MKELFHRYLVPVMLLLIVIEGFVIWQELRLQSERLQWVCDVRSPCRVDVRNIYDLANAVGAAVKMR